MAVGISALEPPANKASKALVTRFIDAYGGGASWTRDHGDHPHEANLLRLDTAKAREMLRWSPLLDSRRP